MNKLVLLELNSIAIALSTTDYSDPRLLKEVGDLGEAIAPYPF
ncbi:MAG: hypothetical protein V7K77_22625 [Nostoc sp.]